MTAINLNVSRETMAGLSNFAELVKKWNSKINLVASVDDIWDRHIIDSAQIYSLAPSSFRWVDIGSGGGFPAIVAAILAKESLPDQRFVLVESDQRKSTFLRTAARELSLNVEVHSKRIEKIESLDTPILTARALASLDKLLDFAHLHLAKDGMALFMKGENWLKEHEAAQKLWSYQMEPIKSQTNPNAAILKIKDIKRA